MRQQIHLSRKEILNAIDKKMDEVADDIFAKSQQNIVDQGLVDEGTLLKSGNINRSYLQKQIVYPVPHAIPTEYGRTPGSMPPVDSIKGWVTRKLGITEEQELNRVSWAIAQDMKKNGQDPRPFLSPAIESVRSKL